MVETLHKSEKTVTKWGLALVEKNKNGKESVSFIASNIDSEKPLTYTDPKVAKEFLKTNVFQRVFGDRQNVEVRPFPDGDNETHVVQRSGINKKE